MGGSDMFPRTNYEAKHAQPSFSCENFHAENHSTHLENRVRQKGAN